MGEVSLPLFCHRLNSLNDVRLLKVVGSGAIKT